MRSPQRGQLSVRPAQPMHRTRWRQPTSRAFISSALQRRHSPCTRSLDIASSSRRRSVPSRRISARPNLKREGRSPQKRVLQKKYVLPPQEVPNEVQGYHFSVPEKTLSGRKKNTLIYTWYTLPSRTKNAKKKTLKKQKPLCVRNFQGPSGYS